MGVALITGASAGIGSEFARLFAKNGHSLILVARRKNKLDEIASELVSAHKIQVWTIDVDLSEPGAGETIFKRVQALGVDVDFLVNNAGLGSGGPFYELPLERELQMINLNVRALVELTHLFLPHMIKRKSGKILNVGSLAGFQPGPFMNTYSATKAFVNSFSEGLHEELKGTGVSCTALAPGYTSTEFQKSAEISGFASSFNKADPTSVALDGYKAMMNSRALKVSGFLNFLSSQSVRLTPRFLMRKIAGQVNRQQV